MVKQALYDVLRTAVALEMAWRVVRAFPGALRTARVCRAGAARGATIVLAGGPHSRSIRRVLFAWQPRVVACTAMLFTLTALLVAWYHLPIRRAASRDHGRVRRLLRVLRDRARILLRSWRWTSRASGTNARGLLAYLGVCLWWRTPAWAREEETMPRSTRSLRDRRSPMRRRRPRDLGHRHRPSASLAGVPGALALHAQRARPRLAGAADRAHAPPPGRGRGPDRARRAGGRTRRTTRPPRRATSPRTPRTCCAARST